MTSNPLVWRLVGHVVDFINGGSYYVWVFQVSTESLYISSKVELNLKGQSF